jgi:hypothetical protein
MVLNQQRFVDDEDDEDDDDVKLAAVPNLWKSTLLHRHPTTQANPMR